MKRKDFILLFLLLLPTVAGYFIGGWGGGVISGVFLSFIIGSTVGKISAYRTMARIDRNVYKSELDRRG